MCVCVCVCVSVLCANMDMLCFLCTGSVVCCVFVCVCVSVCLFADIEAVLSSNPLSLRRSLGASGVVAVKCSAIVNDSNLSRTGVFPAFFSQVTVVSFP